MEKQPARGRDVLLDAGIAGLLLVAAAGVSVVPIAV
jgi:hypothetical protein